ncbi:MAG: hypothetical protein ACHQX3_03745 [Nitrospirales bacterium]
METDQEFFIKAILGATNAKREAPETHMTRADILEMFYPASFTTLLRVEELMLDVLVNSGYEVACMDVKWGADDETANKPPEPARLEAKLEVPGWEIWKFTNMVQIFPRGPGSSGAGPTELWFRPVMYQPPVFTIQ